MSDKKNQKQTIGLQKNSSRQQMEIYFQNVFELYQSGKEFPADLDKVWPLVYNRKEDAVNVLKKKFIEGFDYQSFLEKPKNSKGGRSRQVYEISAPCLEFLIVREELEVFEVYRRVFHKARENHGNITKSLTEQGTYNEGEVFSSSLGNEVISGYYSKGVLYFALNRVMLFLGFLKGGTGYAKKLNGSVLVTRGKQQIWFVSMEWIDELLKRTTMTIPAEKVNAIYHDLFRSEKRLGDQKLYRYRYTGDQMLDVLAMVNRIGKPGLKSDILNKLMEGEI